LTKGYSKCALNWIEWLNNKQTCIIVYLDVTIMTREDDKLSGVVAEKLNEAFLRAQKREQLDGKVILDVNRDK